MEVVRTVSELSAARTALEGRVGFVPTMGALHEGHLSLMHAAQTCDSVLVSIFVNPLQFGPSEDLAAYPRPEEQDLAAAEAAGADLVFIPAVAEMYPPGSDTRVAVGALASRLEGAERPGHFEGVATVVARLFNLTQPDVSFFGQKDAQQVAVVKQMVRDLGFPIEIVVGPTVRAEDGLALSSRNVYLSTDERRQATALWAALKEGESAIGAGAEAAEAERKMLERLNQEPDVTVQYARAVHPATFEGWETGSEVLLVVAAKIGATRLIDNLPVYRDQLAGAETKERD